VNGPLLSTAVALTGGATQVIATGPGVYCGLVVRDTGAGSVFRIWDNASAASGTILDIIVMAASQTQTTFTSILPCRYNNGIFVERVSGTTYEGSVRLA
jgi:hypothetical protein